MFLTFLGFLLATLAPDAAYSTVTPTPGSSRWCQISQSKRLSSCLAALSGTPGFGSSTAYSAFTSPTGSKWPTVNSTAVQSTLSEKGPTPSQYSPSHPSSSSIAMTVLTSSSSSANGTDYFYTIPLIVGKSILHLQLHTLASNTIVYASQPSIGSNISLYVPSRASSSLKVPWKWRGDNVEMDGRNLNGTLVYRDNLIMHDGPVSINQAFAIAKPSGEDESPPGGLAWDGILSLTRQNASLLFIEDGNTRRISDASWFDSILPQLRNPVIGIALRHQDEGYVDLGWTNDKMYADEIQWAYSDSLGSGYWAFHVNSWKIGAEPAVPCDFDMQINTGTRYTTLSPSVVNSFRAQVALQMDTETLGESMYYKCNIILPNVTLNVDRSGGGTFDLVIPGKAFKLGENEDGTCEFGLVSMGGFNPRDFRGVSALGISALRALYVVLNASESIGFAPQVDIPAHF